MNSPFSLLAVVAVAILFIFMVEKSSVVVEVHEDDFL